MDIKSKVLEELDKWLIAQRWNKGQDILQPIKEKTIDLTEKLTREEKIDRIEKAIIFSAVGQGIIETERNRFMEIIDDMKIDVDGERAWLDYKNLKSKILSSERVLSVEKLPTVKESNLSSEKDKVKSKTGDGKK